MVLEFLFLMVESFLLAGGGQKKWVLKMQIAVNPTDILDINLPKSIDAHLM